MGSHFAPVKATGLYSVSDVFNEVDEELRRDKAHELFTRYRPFIIVVTLAIVLGVSGYKGWQWNTTQQKADAAERYTAASRLLATGDYAGAEKALESFKDGASKGYRGLTLMQLASIKAQAGKTAEAAALYTQAADEFSDPLYKDISQLRAVMVVADQLSLADMDAKLALLTGPGRPFRFTARELLAAKAFEEGNLSRAREDYNYLSFALDAPTGARNRASQALALLGPEPQAVTGQEREENKEATQ
ncbi:MAG: hypothetical protein COA84_11075 [Robiginitomaculum sp.]|nr:MAG: hypothetical protein COA84_11075 [Robiginitomaculum sp.]